MVYVKMASTRSNVYATPATKDSSATSESTIARGTTAPTTAPALMDTKISAADAGQVG